LDKSNVKAVRRKRSAA